MCEATAARARGRGLLEAACFAGGKKTHGKKNSFADKKNTV